MSIRDYFRRYFGEKISKQIMLSQDMYPASLVAGKRSLRDKIVSIEHLNLYQFPTNNTFINQNTKIIIQAFGNGECAELNEDILNQLSRTFADKNVIVAGLNFRNVGASSGKAYSEDHWIEDAVLVINHYRRLGVPPQNILLSGHSLGAAILTMAAAKVYQEGLARLKASNPNPTLEEMNNCAPRLINGRSFASLVDIIMLHVLGAQGVRILGGLIATLSSFILLTPPFSLLLGLSVFTSGFISPKIPEFFLRPVLSAVLWLGFGRMNVIESYQSLPDEAKDYIVAKNDLLMQKRVTLPYYLRSQRKLTKNKLDYEFGHETQEEVKRSLLLQLIDLKDSKIFFPLDNKPNMEAHNFPLSQLYTTHPYRKIDEQVSGQTVLINKCRKLLKLT